MCAFIVSNVSVYIVMLTSLQFVNWYILLTCVINFANSVVFLCRKVG